MEATKLDSSVDIDRSQIFIFVKGAPVAFATDASMEITTEEIDISNKMMGDWAGSLPGKKSWTASSEALLTRKQGAMSFDSLLAAQIAGDVLDVYVGAAKASNKDNFGGTFEEDLTQINYTGKAIITSLSLKSTNGQNATCSVSLKGVGALTPVAGVGG